MDWTNPGVREMTQSAHWVSWMEFPWVGMETEGCPYLDGGAGCGNNTVGELSPNREDKRSLSLIFPDQAELIPVSNRS